MRIVHRLLLVALAALLGVALVACGDDKKKDAASEKPAATLRGEGFSVKMPGSPKRQVITAQTAAGPVPITAYITQGGEEGFSMSVLTVPKGVKGDLDGAVQGAAASVKGTLKDTAKTRYQGYPARDARIANAADQNGNKGTVFARVILAKGRVFQLQFVTGGADVASPPAAYTSFVSSLKIG
ncbi:MAG: hypothetical protein QOG42_491 [Solirubrobacteraceae bacterium]|jgi:hypothetical protein|nr:hypothetical protein [Solirubrobacteraceae bacterium]